jgi:threonine dehydrogenase-like Zn-dependent dehydrogenase
MQNHRAGINADWTAFCFLLLVNWLKRFQLFGVFAMPLFLTTQGLVGTGDRVAVLGDGRLGLMCCEVLAHWTRGKGSVTLIGKHPRKMVRRRCADSRTPFPRQQPQTEGA